MNEKDFLWILLYTLSQNLVSKILGQKISEDSVENLFIEYYYISFLRTMKISKLILLYIISSKISSLSKLGNFS